MNIEAEIHNGALSIKAVDSYILSYCVPPISYRCPECGARQDEDGDCPECEAECVPEATGMHTFTMRDGWDCYCSGMICPDGVVIIHDSSHVAESPTPARHHEARWVEDSQFLAELLEDIDPEDASGCAYCIPPEYQ